jgi:hypothetical protein
MLSRFEIKWEQIETFGISLKVTRWKTRSTETVQFLSARRANLPYQ